MIPVYMKRKIKERYNSHINTNNINKINNHLSLQIIEHKKDIIMLSVNFFCNISSYDILAYIYHKELYSVELDIQKCTMRK